MRKVAFLLAAFAGPALAQQPAPASLVREGVTEKLTAHVWAIPDGSASLVPNVGIVVGRKAVLVIDTGMGTRNGETYCAKSPRSAPGKPIYIVTTHVHPEHDMGAHVFPKDSKLIRSKDQIEDIAAGAGMNLVPVFAQRSALNKELLEGRAPPRRRHRLRPRLLARPRWRESKDLRHGHQPYARRYRRARRWRAVLGRRRHAAAAVLRESDGEDQPLAREPRPLEALKPRQIVPSHGPFGDIADHRGISQRISRASAIARPSSRRPASRRTKPIQIITDEMTAQYPDKNRLAGAIRAAYSDRRKRSAVGLSEATSPAQICSRIALMVAL